MRTPYRGNMKQPGSRARMLVMALGAAMTVMSVSAIAASADTNASNGPTDPGVRCAAKVGPGQYEFYLPGEKATDVNGNKWVCGPDGQWFRDYSSLVIQPIRITATVTSSTANVIAQ